VLVESIDPPRNSAAGRDRRAGRGRRRNAPGAQRDWSL
jgi:hypothetical protein